MSASIAEAVRQLVHNKGISEELILQTVEDILLAAYKRKFGTSENAVTNINEETGEVHLYSKKEVVEEVGDDLFEISLEEARERNSECDLKDEVLIEIKPSELGRIAAQAAKQIVFQRLKDIEKNLIYSEYQQKIGQLITGHFQREKNGHIFVELGRTEAILPKSEQSPKEFFSIGERIKAVIIDVQNSRKGTQVVLSRATPLFVQRLFEIDVPEINEGVIQVKSIVRDPGYRTKMSVYAREIDPVGACVGMKGMRIQTIVKELEGEKIDIIRYNDNIREYIANALSPAEIEQVIIINEENKEVLAVVNENQLSLSIGKQGQNVKLASKLTGWHIDIKTMSEFEKLDYEDETRKAAEDLFVTQEEDTHSITQLTDLSPEIISILQVSGISTLEELVEKSKDDLLKIVNLDEDMVNKIIASINENIVVVGEEQEEEISELPDGDEEEVELEEYTYFCPECNTELKEGMKVCPGCHVELEFE